jgi:hypothetical protein
MAPDNMPNDLKPDEDIELSYLDKCIEPKEANFVASVEEPSKETLDTADINPADFIELTYIEKGKVPVMEYGFEVTNPSKSVSIPMCFVAETAAAPSHSTTKDECDERVVCDASANGIKSVEVMKCKEQTNRFDKKAKHETNEWGIKPLLSLSLDYDDNNTLGSDTLSFITMDTKDLTDISDNSAIDLDVPSSKQQNPASLFAKLFTCGVTAVRCGDYEDGHGHDNASRMTKEEKIEKLTRVYDESVKKRHSEDEGACENDPDPAAVKPEVKSTIVAKTKVYPGVEVSEKQGKSKISSNSRSHAIKEMVKMLKKKEKSKAGNSGKGKKKDPTGRSQRKSQKTILERVKVHVS